MTSSLDMRDEGFERLRPGFELLGKLRTTEPPWTWARTLYDDGLIDANFGLTARGRRYRDAR